MLVWLHLLFVFNDSTESFTQPISSLIQKSQQRFLILFSLINYELQLQENYFFLVVGLAPLATTPGLGRFAPYLERL